MQSCELIPNRSARPERPSLVARAARSDSKPAKATAVANAHVSVHPSSLTSRRRSDAERVEKTAFEFGLKRCSVLAAVELVTLKL